MTPAQLCATHHALGLDSNVFIHLFEDDELAGPAAELLDALHTRSGRAVLSTLGVTEILAGPSLRSDPAMAERYFEELRGLEILELMPLTTDLAADAAALIGTGRGAVADAVHLATARAAGATAFVTNDRRIRSTPRLDVVYLSDLT